MTRGLFLTFEILVYCVAVFFGVWMMGSSEWFERVSRPLARVQPGDDRIRRRQTGIKWAGVLLLCLGAAASIWAVLRAVG